MADLLSWFGHRIKDAENGIGGFVNGAASTVNDAVNNVSRAVNQPQQRPQVRPPQIGVNAPRPTPTLRPPAPNVANRPQGFNPVAPLAGVGKNIGDFVNGFGHTVGDVGNTVGHAVNDFVVKPVIDSANTVGNAYASGINYLGGELNGSHAAQQQQIMDATRQAAQNKIKAVTAPSQYVAAPSTVNQQQLLRQSQAQENIANTLKQQQAQQIADVRANNDPVKVGAASVSLLSTVAAPGMSKIATPIANFARPVLGNVGSRIVGNAISQAPVGAVLGASGQVQQTGSQTTLPELINAAGMGAFGGAVLGGAAPEVANLAGKALKPAAVRAQNFGLKPPTKLTPEELAASSKVVQAQNNPVNPVSLTTQDMQLYRKAQSKLGQKPGTPDAHQAVVGALNAHRAFDVAVEQRRQSTLGALENSSQFAQNRLIPGGSLSKNPAKGQQELALDQNQSTTGVVNNTKQQKTNLPQQTSSELNGSQLSDTTGTPIAAQPQTQAGFRGQIENALNNTSAQERGFIETIINDPKTAQHIKDNVTSLYNVRNTKQLQTRAANLVKDNPDLAQQVAQAGNGDVSVAVGSELLKHLQDKGQYETALNLADKLATQLTEAGRTAQAASIYGRLTPEGVLRFAQRELKRYNDSNSLIGDKQLKLTPKQAESLTKKANEIRNLPEGRAKDIASKELVTEIYGLIPASLPQKISTIQTMAQLLNPKTTSRNVLGNSIFGVTDNIAQAGAAGIDKAISAVRGTPRTVALPNAKVQYEGIKTGAKQAIEEVGKGINIGPDTQFEIGDIPTFRKGLLGGLEKTMGYTLRVPDRAAYQAAFDDTVKGLMKANKLDKPTQQILEQANANGLYRTFQDNSRAAQLFSKMKEALNHVGFEGKNGKKFGLGDLILKYPKTPGNILARGIDYSPVGIVKGLLEIAKPAINGKPFDQAAFANAISRGTLGSGALVGAGAALGSLGIITEAPNQDKDARNLQKASGQGGYQINVDALRRFIFSGFNTDAAKLKEGDNLVSYDWAQPLSIPLSAGAALGKGKNAVDGAASTIDTVSQGLNTLVEQPLVTGVNTFVNNIKNKGFVGAGLETLKSTPASFVPTASNQVRQLTDNTKRSTYDPNGVMESLNMLTNKIPGLSYLLKPQVNSLGQNNEVYQGGSNNLFNVLFNPAFTSQYKPDQAAKLPLGIMSDTGETKQIPTTTNTSQKVNGTNVDLTPQQNEDFQRYVGLKTKDYLTQAAKDPKFMSLSQQDQAQRISGAISNIQSAARIQVLGDKPQKVENAVKNIVNTGSAKLNTKPVGDTGSTVDVATNISKPSKDVLDNYNNMTSDEQKKWFNDNNDAEFQYNLAKYENDKANGTLTKAQELTGAKSLRKDKIGANFSKNIRDLYGVSKADLADYLATEEKGVDKKKVAQDLLAYDRALYDSGVSSSMKYKYGIADSGKGGGKGKKGSGASLVNITKYANGIRPPKTTGSKAPSLSIRQPQLKKVANKKFNVRTAKVSGTKKQAGPKNSIA